MKEEFQPLISIIVPIYNVEKYLKRCIDSVIKQTYSNLEIVLVDDGSPDMCPLICDQYAKLDGRIRVIHKKNGGLSSARNAGITVAKGDYISFVDSDDYILPDMIEQLKWLIIETASQIAICQISVDSNELFEGVVREYKEFSAEEAFKEILLDRQFDTSACAKLFDRSLFNQVRFPEGKVYEDYGTIYKLLCQTSKIVSVDVKKYYYAYNESSITKSPFTKKQMDYFDVSDEIECFARSQYPNLVKYVINRKTNMAISLYLRASIIDNIETPCEEKKVLIGIIRENLFQYMFSKYPFRKKISALTISAIPSVAEKMLALYYRTILKK